MEKIMFGSLTALASFVLAFLSLSKEANSRRNIVRYFRCLTSGWLHSLVMWCWMMNHALLTFLDPGSCTPNYGLDAFDSGFFTPILVQKAKYTLYEDLCYVGIGFHFLSHGPGFEEWSSFIHKECCVINFRIARRNVVCWWVEITKRWISRGGWLWHAVYHYYEVCAQCIAYLFQLKGIGKRQGHLDILEERKCYWWSDGTALVIFCTFQSN